VDFVARNSNKLQKLGLEEKMRRVLNVFTLGPTVEVFTLVLYNVFVVGMELMEPS
jgi:hypothetical protein